MTPKNLLMPLWSTTNPQGDVTKVDIEDLGPPAWSFGKKRMTQLRPVMALRLVCALMLTSCLFFFTSRFQTNIELHKVFREKDADLDLRCANRTLGVRHFHSLKLQKICSCMFHELG